MNYTILDKKTFPVNTGVYLISFINSESGKVYIGSSASIPRENLCYPCRLGFRYRWSAHIRDLKNGCHHSCKLQRAYNKYGADNLFFVILKECSPQEVISNEQFYIDKFNSYRNGYNCSPSAGNQFGAILNSASKKKISDNKRIRHQQTINRIQDEVISRYQHGGTIQQISIALGTSWKTIKTILVQNNIPLKEYGFYRRKEIYGYTLAGVFIKKWLSLKDCSEETGDPPERIRFIINDKSSSFNSYFYSDQLLETEKCLEEINKRINSTKQRYQDGFKKITEKLLENSPTRKYNDIHQIDEKGNLIKIWKNTREIQDHFGCRTTQSVSRVLAKKRQTWRGYKWVYFDQ